MSSFFEWAKNGDSQYSGAYSYMPMWSVLCFSFFLLFLWMVLCHLTTGGQHRWPRPNWHPPIAFMFYIVHCLGQINCVCVCANCWGNCAERKDAKVRKQRQEQQRKHEEQLCHSLRVWNVEILPNWEFWLANLFLSVLVLASVIYQ